MTVSDMRRAVRARFPHVTVKVRTVSFSDLARGSAKFATISGYRSPEEYRAIRSLAIEAGLLVSD